MKPTKTVLWRTIPRGTGHLMGYHVELKVDGFQDHWSKKDALEEMARLTMLGTHPRLVKLTRTEKEIPYEV